MGKERFIKSLPHVNASLLSPPRSQFQLNWTNGFGDINCLCNWLSILQSNNNMNDTRGRGFVEACLLRPFLDCFSASTPKKPAKRGPKPKQIGTLGYCRTCECFVYVNGTGQLSRSLKLQRIFCFSQTEDQSSRVCSHFSNQVGSTRAGFSFIKASFQEREHNDDTLASNRMSASAHGSAVW